MRKPAKTVLRIVEENYGTKKIEEAFREALEPYFGVTDTPETCAKKTSAKDKQNHEKATY
ncbi:hypothetical protein [Paludifilum halophilum]|uniref:Uncharacterized protein n=1 Tax=Paludifilum halophilum TaxID=1642702 RepID=A0A235B7U1_9BACL|nr:hypothetical protein [Paludifilum halophilum]OYD08302.1 hypothetical protein CHM34_05485 [Paludifilum halophilum]